jgi:hypothetical protein
MNCSKKAILPKFGKIYISKEIILISPREDMHNQKNANSYENFAIIKCECGFEIPVIPEMETVGSAIDTHVEEHREKQKDSTKGEITANHIHDFLFKKLFEKIAQMNI